MEYQYVTEVSQVDFYDFLVDSLKKDVIIVLNNIYTLISEGYTDISDNLKTLKCLLDFIDQYD